MANVIGVSEDGQDIQVDDLLPQSPEVTYQIDGRPALLAFQSQDVIQIDYDGLCEVGSEVEATAHYSTFQAIDDKLRAFWEKRWVKTQPSETDWSRILAFTTAYLPHLDACEMPIDVESWTEINKRHTGRSARGPDGVSRKDLQCMPQVFKEALVSLLQRLEQVSEWPDSLTTGFVYPLPKRQESMGAGDYRPVIIYSMVYRSWSSHRARRLLRHLHHLAGTRQFGFMPETDASEMWLMAQALIEASCQEDIPLHGYVTDIQKAFENLPRVPIKLLAEQLGAPKSIMDLWFAFLTSMKRRFVIAGQVGAEVSSNHGFPEGCGMSCFAMSLVDISFHCYFHAYSQRTVELSYVDNLELMAFSEQQLQQGIVCLQTWLELWDLHLDADKSYVWSTSPSSRKMLQVLGWRISQVDKDLGAPMAYGKRSATSVAAARAHSLQQLWPMLLRSLAPQWQKEKLLRTALWPRAFYGGAISNLGQEHLRQLRTEAMRALGFRRAGASPAIRLFLLCHEQCDPGYYDAWHSLLTFRRVAAKRPALLDLWQDFMQTYQGQRSQGPFSKLLHIFGQVGWSMEPPRVRTHDRVLLDLLTVPMSVLHDHFQDAWTQQLAITLGKRKDFGNMQGIDRHVLQQGLRKSPSYQHGSLKCLQDGTFVYTGIHSKFDLTVPGTCKLCGAGDSLDHRCALCPHMQHVYAEHLPVLRRWFTLPQQLRWHLLPPRNPWAGPFRRALEQPQAYTAPQTIPDAGGGMIHLFVDGSCQRPELPEYSLASWAIVSATHDCTVHQGALTGDQQSSDRAELEGIIRGVEIASGWNKAVTLWTDSSYAGSGLSRLLQDLEDIPDSQTHELEWRRLRDALAEFPAHLYVQHVPGHGAGIPGYQDVAEWASYWNHRADRAAALAFTMHSPEVRTTWRNLLAHHDQQLELQQRLQALHWDVAQVYQQTQSEQTVADGELEGETPDPQDPHVGLRSRLVADENYWLDGMVSTWLNSDAFLKLAAKFSMQFTRRMVDFILECRDHVQAVRYSLSWLELATVVFLEFKTELPIPSTGVKGQWVASTTQVAAGRCTAPTVAAILRLTKAFFSTLGQEFELVLPRQLGLNLAAWGVHPPQSGVIFQLPTCLAVSAAAAIQRLTLSRPLRTVNDLSRPF